LQGVPMLGGWVGQLDEAPPAPELALLDVLAPAPEEALVPAPPEPEPAAWLEATVPPQWMWTMAAGRRIAKR
jgi:hypothetical protein